MFGVRLDQLVGNIVRRALNEMTFEERNPRHDRVAGTVAENGIGMEVSLSVYDPMVEKYEECRRHYFLLFCGNVNVFMARAGKNHTSFEDVPADMWVNTSNHDSCWSSDGLNFLSEAYFEMCKEVNPSKPPILLESTAQIGFIGNFYTPVRIVYKPPTYLANKVRSWQSAIVSVKRR